MKRLLALLLMLVLAVAPTLAQTEQWSVLLLNNNTSDLLQVYADGTTQTHDLGLPDLTLNTYGTSVSNDGHWLAFCQGNYTDPEHPTFTLNIYDLTTDTLFATYDLGQRVTCNPGRYAFSPDSSRIAVGLLNYITSDPNVDTSLPVWEVLNVDIASGILDTLTDQSPEVQGLFTANEHWSLMPDIRFVTDTSIIFALVMWATDATPSIAVTWDVADAAVTSTPEWGALGASTLVTSEGITRALTGLDETLPAGEAGGPMPSTNRVQVIEPGVEPVTVYINTEDLPFSTQFINNGSALAVQVLEGFDPAQPEVVRGNYWLAINRDGSITALTDPIQNFNVLRAAPNGSILFTGNMDQGTGITTFKLDYLRPDGTMTTLWDNTGDTANHFWDIAWVTPSPVSADLTPFPPAF